MAERPKSKKPLSSASEIMSRHDKKRHKWFRNLLHHHEPKQSSSKEAARKPLQPEPTAAADKTVSRSLENIGEQTLRVIGLDGRAASLSQLAPDEDNISVTSCSSTDSDYVPADSPSQRELLARQASTFSSDSESSIDFNPIWQDFDSENSDLIAQHGVPKSSSSPRRRGNSGSIHTSESGLSSLFYSYLPFWGSSTKGSMESLNSQSEDKRALVQLVETSESDQEPLAPSNRHVLMQNPFHQLEVWLREGKDLVIRDSCGTSDPYVKFKSGNKQLYKSRTVQKNLNPKWDERFVLSIEDVLRPILVKVYDYDRGSSDDSMGSAEMGLDQLQHNVPTDLELRLSEKGKSDYMGVVKLTVTLVPKSQEDKDQVPNRDTLLAGTAQSEDSHSADPSNDTHVHCPSCISRWFSSSSWSSRRRKYLKRTVKLTDKESSARKLKMQMWVGVVTIVLVEGRDLIPMDDNGLSDPYVKFKLGNEKYRSKHKSKTLNPTWLEQFDLRMYQGQTNHLEIVMYDHDVGRDDFMGRAVIDLTKLKREITHTVEQALEDGAGILKLLITISGTTGHETISDLSAYAFNPRQREEIIRSYGVFKSLNNFKDVGWLQVKVYKAENLMAADLGGKSDPFCVLELVNTRLQTHTEYKTLKPEWNKVFTFNVKDIHSVLEVTVYDEDRDKKVEFLGKIAIPLLKIRPQEKRWYALKDKKLIRRTKGSILLEFDFIFNHFKAGVRTVNPKEEKYMQPEPKFKISVMKKNIDRVSTIISAFLESARFVNSCFNWDSPVRSITAFIVFLVVVWNFEVYMLPLTLLVLLLKNVLVSSITSTYSKDPDVTEYEEDEEDFDDDDGEKEEKKSFKEKLHAAQEICLQVQEGLDVVASLGERVKNTFLWSVPWLTSLLVIALTVVAFILYFIPVRYLILAWGINKFTKKLRAPNAIPNNEALDFLSRVPSDKELVQYRELRPDINTIPSRKKTK